MKKILPTVLLTVLTTSIFWLSCSEDSNPLTPSSLAGTYTFVSLTYKPYNSIVNAGDPVDLGRGLTGTISGTLELTETAFYFTITVEPPAGVICLDQCLSWISSGTYAINGSTMTVVVTGSNIPGIEVGTNTFTVRLNGNRLTMENDEVKIVFDKQ